MAKKKKTVSVVDILPAKFKVTWKTRISASASKQQSRYSTDCIKLIPSGEKGSALAMATDSHIAAFAEAEVNSDGIKNAMIPAKLCVKPSGKYSQPVAEKVDGYGWIVNDKKMVRDEELGDMQDRSFPPVADVLEPVSVGSEEHPVGYSIDIAKLMQAAESVNSKFGNPTAVTVYPSHKKPWIVVGDSGIALVMPFSEKDRDQAEKKFKDIKAAVLKASK